MKKEITSFLVTVGWLLFIWAVYGLWQKRRDRNKGQKDKDK